MRLRSKQRWLNLKTPILMGVLNVTPDSFSDGGRFNRLDTALFQAEKLWQAGATFVDVGGESTRPNAALVSESEELDRVLPVLEALKSRFDGWVSVDTRKASVMRAAIAAGCDLINDVQALQGEGCLEAVAESEVAVCLMHMQGQPQTMQAAPCYENVVAEVAAFLRQRQAACERAGIDKARICLDPGFGFGKTLAHNLQLLKGLSDFPALGLERPLLVGLSRKSMFQQLLGLPVEQRLVPSVAAALLAAQAGAKIIRCHDVQETQQVLDLWQAVRVS
jgi:dihydropteroate synthase